MLHRLRSANGYLSLVTSPQKMFLFALVFFCALVSAGQTVSTGVAVGSAITITDTGVTAAIHPDSVDITLLVNNSGAAAEVEAMAVLLDATDKVIATGNSKQVAASGKTKMIVHIPRPTIQSKSKDDTPLLWARLRYSIKTTASEKPSVQGIVSLAAITPDLYLMNIAYPASATPGKAFQVRVRTLNPVTYHPVGEVKIHAKADFGMDDTSSIEYTAITNGKGDAVITLTPPTVSDDHSIAASFDGEKSGVKSHEEIEIHVENNPNVTVSTDKPIYQPGQKLMVRVLAFSRSQHALAGHEYLFKLTDPDSEVVLQGKGMTDDYGIAIVEWALSENIRLGGYTIEVSDSESKKNVAYAYVRVS